MNRSLVALALLAISASCAYADVPALPRWGGNPVNAADAWWSPQDAGWIGAIGGTSIGLLGAVIGTLGGLGIARRFVLTLTLGVLVMAGITLLVGIGAVMLGQPYHVYFPLLLLGGIPLFSLGINYPVLKRRYEQRELQKMSALDS